MQRLTPCKISTFFKGASLGMSAICEINTTSLSSAHVSIIKGFAQYYASITFDISRFAASPDSLQSFGALIGTGGFNGQSGGTIPPTSVTVIVSLMQKKL